MSPKHRGRSELKAQRHTTPMFPWSQLTRNCSVVCTEADRFFLGQETGLWFWVKRGARQD